ncbi:MAG: hypothetical protein J6U93_02070 [Alistipes sp.]|nr:hypothetical protein [Alistipes sp.]
MEKLYNKIMSFVGCIPADKALHFIAGGLMTATVATIFPGVENVAFIAAILAGVGKEIFDEYTYGGFDGNDTIATALGGLIAQVFIWL